jgi:SH3-like domain-containing protein
MPRLAAALALVLAASLVGCSKTAPPPPPVAAAGAVPAPAGAPPAAGAATAFVSAATALRREPTDAAKVAGAGRKDAANALAVLQRGEKVTLVELRDEWAKVRTSDDKDGWVRRAALLEGDGVVEATVLSGADVFDRPDLLAANAKRKIDPGTLLLVVKAKPPFTEVNVSAGPNAWVLSDRLSTAEREVSVAKLAEKARFLVRSGKPDEAKQMLSLAREHFAGSPLLDALATELGELPTAPAPGTAPAAGPTVPAALPPGPPPPSPFR